MRDKRSPGANAGKDRLKAEPQQKPAPPAGHRRGRLLAAALLFAAVGVWLARVPWGAETPPAVPHASDPEIAAALTDARNAAASRPFDAAAWGRLGTAFHAHEYAPEAIASYEVAARLDPADARWPYLLGSLAAKSDPERALAAYRRAAAAPPPDGPAAALAPLALGEALAANGDWPGAEAAFRAALGRRPGDARTNLGLGQTLFARDDAAGAAACFRAAASDPVAGRRARAQLALLARLRGDEAAAQIQEREAAKCAPDPPWPDPLLAEVSAARAGRAARLASAFRLLTSGRAADALAALEPLAKSAPNDAEVLVLRAQCLTDVGRLAEAADALREAARLRPGLPQAHFLFGEALGRLAASAPEPRRSELLREGIARLAEAAALQPDDAEAPLARGRLEAMLGDWNAAASTLATAAARRPDRFEAHAALVLALLRGGRRDEARSRLADAGRALPGAPGLELLRREVER